MIDPNTVRAIGRSGRYLLRRAIGGNRQSLADVARKTVMVCSGHTMRAIKPYFDVAHLARIQNTRHYTASEIVKEHLNRQSMPFFPVLIHWVDDAWIIDGSVFVRGASRIDLRNALENRSLLRYYSLLPTPPYREMSSGVLAGSVAGSTWFGHWLEDEVPLLMLGCAYGQPVAHVRREFLHETAYRTALRLPAPTRCSIARIGTLAIIEEFAQNPHKTMRYAQMRQRLSQHPKGKDRVFLYRGASGTPRNLVNERELADRLEKEGFFTVDVATATFDDLMRLCLGASIVIGVEGSQLAHALFMMKDYGAMLILCPPYQVHTTVADIGIFCRLSAGMFVCEAFNGADETGFFADPDEVLRFMDKLILHGEQSRTPLGAYVDEVISLAGRGGEVAPLCGKARELTASAA